MIWRRTSSFRRLLSAAGLGLAASMLSGASDPPAKPSIPATPTITAEQKAALDALDGVIARFDAMLAKDDDAKHKAATQAVLDEYKARRNALHAAFDQSKCDELRVDLNLEFQRLGAWLAPPTTPPPRSKAASAAGK